MRNTAYRVAVVVACLGFAAAIAWGVVRTIHTLDRPDGFARAPIPGELAVRGVASGEKAVYYEGNGQPRWRELGLRVTGPSGTTIPVRTYTGNLQYDIGDDVASAIASFRTLAAGRYRVSTTAREPGARLAVGADLGGDVKRTVFWATIIVLVGLLAAAAIAAPTYRRRSAVGAA